MNSPPADKKLDLTPTQHLIYDFFDYSSSKKTIDDVNKENIDPFGKLITPLKAKHNNAQNSLNRSKNRSPLQDITPPLKGASMNKKISTNFYTNSNSGDKNCNNIDFNLKFLR